MHSAVGQAVRARSVHLLAEVPAREDEWVLPDASVPESIAHRDTVDLLRLILLAFIARSGRDAVAAANLACRWDASNPRIGVDPDVALIEPAPPDGPHTKSLLTWLPGHVPPRFAVEVVSPNHPWKDYDVAPVKYALLGTRELVIFDPEGVGPRALGGPYLLQVWRRSEEGPAMTRTYAGEGPARSEELGAWLVPTPDRRLRISDDAGGSQLWLTAEEVATAAARGERQRAEAALRASARAAIEDLCEAYGVPLDDARRAHLASLDLPALEAVRAAVKQRRAWPG